MPDAAAAARPPLTDAQRAAVLATGHTLLEAGAGSGKTTTLVAKILHALGAEVVPGERAARPCGLGEIAAITFTTAAAADLRRSLRDRLRAYAATDRDPRWRRLVYEVDRARIGTIHSFCGQILRELALREGMDPSFGVLDAAEAAELRERCARARLYAALGDDDADAGELAFAFGPHGAVAMIREAMESGDAARVAYDRWCDERGRAKLAALRESVERSGKPWRGHDDAGAALAATVLRLARGAGQDFDEQLERQGALDYDALVYRARDLLARSPAALAGLRRRLAWLFIDEFQDTDPAQRDIAYLICGVEESLASKAAAIVGCPSLCIVGDPKQSIYGFRRADVTLWNQVARDFRAIGAPVISLDVNFRSRAPLLGLVNGTFGRLMAADGDDAPDYEVRYHALAASRDYMGDDGLVELLELPAEGNAEARRTEEARRIARRVRAIVDDGEAIVWDGRGEKTRASWRDIALLFRSKGDVRLYEAELRRLDVPCYVSAGDGFFATREVRDVRLLLSALCDAYDDIAWAGVLRSPWVGLSDDALLRLRHERPRLPLSRALDVALPAGDDGESLAFARRWLDELRQLRDRVSCAALIERALERSGYAAALLYQQGGDVALANVRKLVRMADGRPDESLAGFVGWLVERGASEARESEAALHTAGENVVTLTTVHGAKGLEWPVVFLCDLDRDMPGASGASSLLLDPDVGIAVRLVDPAAASEDDEHCGAYECLRAREQARDVAEEKRVWYVASTRARDRLVLCAKRPAAAAASADDDATEQKTPKPTPARWLLESVATAGDALRYVCGDASWSGRVVSDLAAVAAAEPPPPPPRFAEVASSSPPTSARLERRLRAVAPVAPLFRRSATELMVFARDRDEHRRSYLLGIRPSPFAKRNGNGNGNGATHAAATGDALDARTTGDIVHSVLELHGDLLGRDLDALLEREVASRLGDDVAASLPAGAMARLRDLVERTRAHPSVARLVGGDAVERELPFTWFLDVDGAPSVLHGAMDLVARVEGMLEILDFKTHRIASAAEAAATAKKYALQRDLYAAALHEVLGTPAAFRFFFPETSDEVHEALGADEVAAGRERVCGALREVAEVLSGQTR